MRQSKFITIIFVSALCGCVHTQHKSGLADQQLKPSSIRSLKQFEGVFANSPRGSGPYLSHVIFPGLAQPVDAISSKVLDDSHIQIRAQNKGAIVQEIILEMGKDFTISFSKIPVESKVKSSGDFGSDYSPPGAGVGVRKGELFLNSDGNLIYHSSTKAAALVLYVVPLIGSDNSYGIYQRINQSK